MVSLLTLAGISRGIDEAYFGSSREKINLLASPVGIPSMALTMDLCIQFLTLKGSYDSAVKSKIIAFSFKYDRSEFIKKGPEGSFFFLASPRISASLRR